MRFLLALAAALLVSAPAGHALACATCAAGDPMADAPSTESMRPFEGRSRAGMDARVGRVRVDGITVAEERVELEASHAPTRALLVSVGVPALRRTIASSDGALTPMSLGDVEARGAVTVTSDLASRGRFAIVGGLRFPTAPVQHDAGGRALPSPLQPGCSALVPFAGASWARGGRGWLFLASGMLLLPYAVRDAPHAGEGLRASAALQIELTRAVAWRAGTALRLDAAGEDGQRTEQSSGGFVGYATGELVVAPLTDLALSLGMYVPAVQALRGAHKELGVATFSAAYDF
jgi:hypothetical protein